MRPQILDAIQMNLFASSGSVVVDDGRRDLRAVVLTHDRACSTSEDANRLSCITRGDVCDVVDCIVSDRPRGVEWTVDQDLPPMQCGDDDFADLVLKAADVTQSGSPELVTKPHATDAGWLSQAGTECVVCGPAEPGEAHTETESVSIAVLERCQKTYRRALEAWV